MKINNIVRFALVVLVAFMAFCSFGCGSKSKEEIEKKEREDWIAQNSKITPADSAAVNKVKAEQTEPGYTPPKATYGDKASYVVDKSLEEGREFRVKGGTFVAKVSYHALALFLALLWVVIVPGVLFGGKEMKIEGLLLVGTGIVFLMSDWVAELGYQGKTWFCLILPGAILFVTSFFAKEGIWKLVLVFGPIAIAIALAIFGVVDSFMVALIHGSYLAVAVVIFVIYAFVHTVDKAEDAVEHAVEGHGDGHGDGHH